jgi:protein Mpv17
MASLGSSPFQSASAQRFAQSSSIRQHGRVGLVSGRHGRQSLRVAAILSNGPRAVEQVSAVGPAPPVKTRSLGTPLAEQLPAFERDSVVAHAGGDAASEAVPLPEPERTPQIDVNWLNAVIDNTVKVPYNAYSSALKTRPLLTKACTSMVGFVLGDLIAQHFSHPGAVDILRAARLGAYGFLIDGPIGSMWYDVLEKYVYPTEQTSTKAVLAKTALDQVVYATIMTAVYFAVIKTWEGHPELIMATLTSKFGPTLAANYVIWPIAHLINFRFVPSDYRILYNNVICVAWLTYLSLLTHTKINILSFLHLTH